MQELIKVDGKFYLIDMDKLASKIFEPLPMVSPPPDPGPLRLLSYVNDMPVIRTPSFLLIDPFGPDAPEWKFFYLFPLNKRSRVRRSK